MASRKIEDLIEPLQIQYREFADKMIERGLLFIVVCTARHVSEQRALYAQGRHCLNSVNILRAEAGLPPITEIENRCKVTWTRKSKHLVDKDHPKSEAFDIALKAEINGIMKVHWDVKIDSNQNGISDYLEAGEIGESVGLKWGGRFSSPDYPHYEYIEK